MAIAIFLLTLTLIIWQPRGLGFGFSALGGALLALVTGVVRLQDIPVVWAMVGNATVTLIALAMIALIFHEAGFFRWVALHLTNLGVGRGRLLFCWVVLLGALVTALLTPNGTSIIWTWTILEMTLVLGFSPKSTLAFVFASGFIGDTISWPLPTSSLVALISVDYFQISVWRYVMVMVPVYGVAITTSLAVLWFYFDRQIPTTYNFAPLPLPNSVIRDPLICKWSFAILGLLLVGYFLAEPLGIPVCFIAIIGGLIMLMLAGRWFCKEAIAIVPIRKVLRETPWQFILFMQGMSLLAIGLRNTGITTWLSQPLTGLSGWGLTLAATGTGFLSALLSSLFNNLPTVLVNAQAIQQSSGIEPTVREAMVYANVIGCTMGAKMTPIGSLSTLFCLNFLTRRGFRIRWSYYVCIAFILTIPVLFISLLSLAIWLPWLIA